VTLKIESLGKVSACLFVFTMMSMASVYGADTARLDPVDYINPIIGTQWHQTLRQDHTRAVCAFWHGAVESGYEDRQRLHQWVQLQRKHH